MCLYGAYINKKGPSVMGARKKEIADVKLMNPPVGLFLDSI